MAHVRRLDILSRDPDLVIRGYLPYERAEIVLEWLAVGSWSLTLPATPAVLARLGPGWGIVARLDGEQIMSGSLEEPTRRRAATGADSGPGTVTVTGADDLAIVAGELAYPVPAFGATDQNASATDSRTGPAETVIKGYVGANIGVGRTADRRDPAAPLAREVVVAADLGRGDTVSFSARFDALMDVVRQCHGGLGVRVDQVGSALVFNVVEPVDRSNSATFSFESGNLTACEWVTGMPETTHVVVAGQGVGPARNIRERRDSVAANTWRQVNRTFLDQRHTSSAAELDAAADEVLADARRSGVITATLVDTARMSFGRDYHLGDRVTISPEPGTVITDQIGSVRITATADSGRLDIVPTAGWVLQPYESQRDRQVEQIDWRVGHLERSQ